MVATSPGMRAAFALLRRVVDHDAPVLVLGETGTGKELVARGLHDESRRGKEPFVVVDLGALSAGVIESELFGHVRGAFTGAVAERAGAFEAAGAGTVFLDELGEMPLALQPRLLRALESGDTKRVGANRYLRTHARVVAATNRDLAAEVEDRTFREDLYHRLAVVVVTLPPLRDRPEDIPLLVDLIVGDRGVVPRATRDALAEHDWPGNVRQLRHVLERALILAPGGTITAELLGLGVATEPRRELAPFKDAKQRLVDAWEREYVAELVERSAGNLSAAARRAGIARGHLHRLLRKHGIAAREDDA
jgi:DNA-binding NtrC family response regulator